MFHTSFPTWHMRYLSECFGTKGVLYISKKKKKDISFFCVYLWWTPTNLYKPTAVFSREEICDISWRNQPLQIQNWLKRKQKMWKSLKSLGPGEMNGNRRRTGLPITIMRFCSERKSVIELLAFPNGVMI